MNIVACHGPAIRFAITIVCPAVDSEISNHVVKQRIYNACQTKMSMIGEWLINKMIRINFEAVAYDA